MDHGFTDRNGTKKIKMAGMLKIQGDMGLQFYVPEDGEYLGNEDVTSFRENRSDVCVHRSGVL